MRVSPAAWLADDLGDTARLAAKTAEVSHNHYHGMVGAKATAVAVRMALEGWSKEEIRNVLTDRFGYDLSRRVDDIRPHYSFEASCQKSVPEALMCRSEEHTSELQSLMRISYAVFCLKQTNKSYQVTIYTII